MNWSGTFMSIVNYGGNIIVSEYGNCGYAIKDFYLNGLRSDASDMYMHMDRVDVVNEQHAIALRKFIVNHSECIVFLDLHLIQGFGRNIQNC